ncbi:hypothetical protein ABPG74_018397 [Tetrahymena malaccensis]
MNKKLVGNILFLLFIASAFGQKLKSSKSLISKKSQQQRDFQKFKKTYAKSYESNEHESYRFNVFLENQKVAERLNNKNPSAQYGVTKFSDYTQEEFLSLFAFVPIPSDQIIFGNNVKDTPKIDTQVKVINIPEKWDIRFDGPGTLQKVKDQGQCGSCWAFGVSCTIENLYSFKKNLTLNLSEQQQIDCNPYTYGCQGGWPANGYDYAKETGLTTSSKYPYEAVKGTCRFSVQQMDKLYKINGYKQIQSDQKSIKQALITNGALTVIVDASKWQAYRGGILQTNYPIQLNKVANIIGYGPNYWLLRNSWGSGWGENGYIRVDNNGNGGIDLQYVYQPYL